MRRSGRTTRQVDEAIQTLFTTGKVVWHDHAAFPDNMAQRHGWAQLLKRLWYEHHLDKENLIIDKEKWTLKLK